MIVFEITHLVDFGDILKCVGKDIFKAFCRRHEKFYRIKYSIFSNQECSEILEWMNKSKRVYQPINFGIQDPADMDKR